MPMSHDNHVNKQDLARIYN